MNHLAHFFLSGKDEETIIGNFIVDFLRPNNTSPPPSVGIKKGITLHHAIDNFTDTHPVVKRSTKRLHPYQHKYAPVLVDIYYDYFLAKNWSGFSKNGESLEQFVQNIYAVIGQNKTLLPVKLAGQIDLMIKDNFLIKYTNYEGLTFVFDKMLHRVKFDNDFPNAVNHLKLLETELNRDFLDFFPELMEHVL
jgi:acyl carrier protein phosphodiesterase